VPTPSRSRGRAVIVLRYVTHYRVPFLEGLRDELTRRGIELVLIAGAPEAGDGADSKEHTVDVPWAQHVRNRWIRVGDTRLLWQPIRHLLRPGDLVISDQASTLLVNYVLLVRQLLGRQRMALWGHGRNFQARTASRVGEAVKRLVSRRVHWWFAYNRLAAEVVRDLGFPADRITDVQNAIDTRSLSRAAEDLRPEALEAVRTELGLTGRHIGVYIGGMYAEKRLPLLIDACDRIRAEFDDFEMIFIGKGPDADVVRAAASSRSWLHHVGVKVGAARVPYLAGAQVLLMPGLVGLAVLDAFAVGTPLVTTSDAEHSPEIAYLEDGVNGLVVPGAPVTAAVYADAVVALLRDPERLAGLTAGARAARDRYTIEEMVRRFADGVESALAR
jgi:glycosyltransferase involved in cell wall biosynthesis